MFIGHYGPALAIKQVSPRAPMWALMAGVQILDVFWGVFVQIGVERAHLDPADKVRPLILDYMPYSHSLAGALVISFAFALLVSALVRQHRWNVFVWVGLAGFSHWLLDLLVHFPDLTLFGGPPKFGFGLWAFVWPEFWAEVALVLAGLFVYLRATKPGGTIGRIAPWCVAALLVAIGYAGMIMPVGADARVSAAMALGVYGLMTLGGLWLDRVRTAVDPT